MSLVSEWLLLVRMERRTSRSLSELAEAGEEKSLLGKEVEKLTGISSLDTLVPEEEVEAPISTNQVLWAIILDLKKKLHNGMFIVYRKLCKSATPC